MQTIKVKTRTTTMGSVTMFSINGTCIAHVGTDLHNAGRYAGRIDHAGGAMCNNCTFAHAVEFITDAITAHFAAFGLAVEFTA